MKKIIAVIAAVMLSLLAIAPAEAAPRRIPPELVTIVPNVVGYSTPTALSRLELAYLPDVTLVFEYPGIKPLNFVTGQDPAAGRMVMRGTPVTLTVR